jgi:two-component system, LytTR family, response regulator
MVKREHKTTAKKGNREGRPYACADVGATFSAIDYLLKPIDPIELKATVQKILHKQSIDHQQIESLRRQLYTPRPSMGEKLALPYQHGYIFIEINDIVFAESDDCYVRLYLSSGEMYLVTKSLRELEETLDSQQFFRIHRQYLVGTSVIVIAPLEKILPKKPP